MKLIVANFKMNKNSVEMSEYLEKVSKQTFNNKIVLLPSLTNLFLSTLYQNENISYGVQNFFYKDEGNYTGECNLSMLEGMNVEYALVGHNERRKQFKESNATINKKILYALEKGVTPILCVGESFGQTRNNLYKAHLKRQISLALKGVKVSDLEKVVIAYEPTYSIGAENAADLLYVESNIQLIKEVINSKSAKTKINPVVLYGGSVNIENYEKYLNSEYIDGLLIGRAILDADNLIKIGS
ncbi:MAG: triose-phosphate isomerase family protein [Christensenellales bacterium]